MATSPMNTGSGWLKRSSSDVKNREHQRAALWWYRTDLFDLDELGFDKPHDSEKGVRRYNEVWKRQAFAAWTYEVARRLPLLSDEKAGVAKWTPADEKLTGNRRYKRFIELQRLPLRSDLDEISKLPAWPEIQPDSKEVLLRWLRQEAGSYRPVVVDRQPQTRRVSRFNQDSPVLLETSDSDLPELTFVGDGLHDDTSQMDGYSDPIPPVSFDLLASKGKLQECFMAWIDSQRKKYETGKLKLPAAMRDETARNWKAIEYIGETESEQVRRLEALRKQLNGPECIEAQDKARRRMVEHARKFALVIADFSKWYLGDFGVLDGPNVLGFGPLPEGFEEQE